MKKKTKRFIAAITGALLLFVYYNYDYKYVPQYEIVGSLGNNIPYSTYRYGNIYIVKSEMSIPKEIENSFDVYIIDQRNLEDPNIKIVSSYKITDKEARNDILEVILEYEKRHPSEWKRSISSLRLEWFVHNLLYFFRYKTDRTIDVDLNNDDEEKYKNEFYEKILKI